MSDIMKPSIAKVLETSTALGIEIIGKGEEGKPLTKAEKEFVDALAELGALITIFESIGGVKGGTKNNLE